MKCLAALLLAWQALSAAAQPLPAGVTQLSQVEGITEYRLDNGLQLLLAPDPSKPTTTVNLTLRVGSRHENYGETGMAHLLEHLIFKGTPTTRNAWAEFARRGLRANGTTWTDRTNYFASFGADEAKLRWYLGWQADALVNSFIAREDLATEMTVVRNEMEMGENNPGRVLFQRTLSAMYDWHNYGKSTIGARQDVENVDIARLQAFYRRWYQPDNATVIVTGRFAPAQVLQWVSETYGRLPRPQRELPFTYTLDPPQDGERMARVRRVGGAPMIYLGLHVPPGSHPDFAAVELLAQVFGDTPAGRLHKALVQRQLAAGAFGFALAFAEPGALMLGATLAPGQALEPAQEAFAAALQAVIEAQPVTAEELERARTQWLNAWEQGFQDPEVIGVQLSEAIALGDWRLYFLGRDQVRRTTLADVRRVARERFGVDNRSWALYQPVAAPQRAPAPAKVDVAGLVRDYKGDPNAALAEAFDATPAALQAREQRSALATGLRVSLLPKGTRGRAVQARLVLHHGDEKSLFGRSAQGQLLGAVLGTGAEGLSRQQLSDRLDQLRTEVRFRLDEQRLQVDLSSVREHLPAALTLLGQVLRQAVISDETLQEKRRNGLAGIERQRKEPEALVVDALDRHASPYARGDLRHVPSFEQRVQDLEAVTVGQLRDYHREFIDARQGEFAAVGDMDVAAVRRALDTAFGGWTTARAGPYRRVARPAPAATAGRFVIETPDRQNASFRAQLVLPIDDRHADAAALRLANHVFGFFGSGRLWMRIREAEGLSYDVRSSLTFGTQDAHTRWVSTAIFAPQNRDRVEAAWQAELARSLDQGFSAGELEQARRSLLDYRRLSRSQDAALAAMATRQLHLDRDFLHEQREDERIAAVTLEQVNAAWRRWMDPARIAVAWAGDFKAAR